MALFSQLTCRLTSFIYQPSLCALYTKEILLVHDGVAWCALNINTLFSWCNLNEFLSVGLFKSFVILEVFSIKVSLLKFKSLFWLLMFLLLMVDVIVYWILFIFNFPFRKIPLVRGFIAIIAKSRSRFFTSNTHFESPGFKELVFTNWSVCPSEDSVHYDSKTKNCRDFKFALALWQA